MQLSSAEIITTITRLEQRIRERFPDAGLAALAAELSRTAREVTLRTESFGRPNWPLRAAIGAVLLGVAGVVYYVVTHLRFVDAAAWDVLEGVDAAISSLVFLGAAALFLVTMERRLVRNRILAAIEELRELAHIVDMHQLTKDPESVSGMRRRTQSSPDRRLEPFLLVRYLDYCSEMLSLIGKVASLYAHGSKDSEVLEAIDNLDDLTTRLSLKIWQKIAILNGALPN